MSAVCPVASSSIMWCVTTSLFLNATVCPTATVAGLGLYCSDPPLPVIVIVTVVGVDGDVGVLVPPPPPPQLTLDRAVAMATAIVPDIRIDYPPRNEPDRR